MSNKNKKKKPNHSDEPAKTMGKIYDFCSQKKLILIIAVCVIDNTLIYFGRRS